jgi:ATP-dependent Clp protease adapter protein ClpS
MIKPPFESAETETTLDQDTDNPWQVVLFNDDVHGFEEVILQIQKATGYPLPKAVELTLRVHEKGKASIYFGALEVCENVEAILSQISLITRVEKT